MHRHPHDDRIEVIVVDPASGPTALADEIDPGVQAHEPALDEPRVAHAHRHQGFAVLVALAVVVGLVGADGAARSAAEDRLRAATGGIETLVSPPQVRWRTEVPPSADVLVAGDVLVVAGEDLTGVSVADGGTLWSRTIASGTACVGFPSRVAEVLCVTTTSEVPGESSRPWLEIVDARTGSALVRVAGPAGTLATAPAGDGEVVVVRDAVAEPGQGPRATLLDVRTGAERWSTRLPATLGGGGQVATGPPGFAPTSVRDPSEYAVVVTPSTVRVVGPDVAAVLTRGGVEIAGAVPSTVVDLPDGRAVVHAPFTHSSTVVGADGVADLEIEGRYLAPAASDGAPTSVLLGAEAGVLSGYDSDDGTRLWSVASGPERSRAIALADGVAVLASVTGVEAVDVLTGATRWRRPIGSTRDMQGFTDGRNLYVLSSVPGSTSQLVRSVGLDGGAERWVARLPGDDAWSVVAVDGVLLARGDGFVEALG